MSLLPLQPASLPTELPSSVGSDRKASRRRFDRPPLRPLVWIGVILLLAAGIGSYLWNAHLRPYQVQVARVAANLPEQVFGLGTVGARVQSNVGFKVAGVLVALNADAGDRVGAGSVLAKLDDRDVVAQLASARAAVAQAQANITKANADVASAAANLTNAENISNRRARLVPNGVVSTEEAQTADAAQRVARASLQVARSEVTVDQASLAAAQAQEAYAKVAVDNDTLRAPYDALVVARNLQLGSMPVPGQSVFTLVDPDTIWVLSYVDERLAGRLAVGQPATIVLRSAPSHRLPGHIARIEIQSDPVNEERLVDIAFDQVPAKIHLAEQAQVFITTGTLARAVAVPATAVSDLRGSRGTVWTLESGRLQKRRVAFGPELLDGRLPITGGLPDGAQVVTAPTSGLSVGRRAVVAQDTGR